ncbi:MAG: DNA ligase D [Candidatus Binatia bacterium]
MKTPMVSRGALVRKLERLGAPRRAVRADAAGLMLAETRDDAFSAKEWIFELKIDGFRMLTARENGKPRLLFRRGHDATKTFPDVAAAVGALPGGDFVLDGEVTVLDDAGRPSFQRLQKRVQLTRDADIRRAAAQLPAVVYVFDLLAFDGFDLRELPLVDRKACLRSLLPKDGTLRYVDHFAEDGERLFEQVKRMDLEGIMAKKADSPYRAGRSAAWLKIRVVRTDDFAVVGFTEPAGSRTGLGALHLGTYEDGTLVYAGRAGSGFTQKQLAAVRDRLERRRRKSPPFAGLPPAGKEHVWVDPELVCEVRFRERTDDGLLRQPVFLRFRDDKAVEGCTRDGVAPAALSRAAKPKRPAPERATEPKRVPFTNLDKIFWPNERYTKGDLVEFYRVISPWILPYLRDRPLVLTRYPDGIDGKSFFQKDAPEYVPAWLRRERMWSEQTSRDIDYFICDDVESLLYLANLGTIPIHVWSSRVPTLETPDYCILDLDPKGAPFTNVVKIARAIRELCEDVELDCFIKTSGASGLHVLLPLARQCDYEQSKTLGELLANQIVRELPDIATVTRTVSARKGRVYVDFLQNGHGKTIAGPFSVRPLPGAPVSTPLEWSEVTAKLDPARFTIRSVPARMEKKGADPLRPILERKLDLVAVLTRLAARHAR